MNFKLNLMLIPFTYRPSDGIQLSPFVRHHNSQFSILNYCASYLLYNSGKGGLLPDLLHSPLRLCCWNPTVLSYIPT